MAGFVISGDEASGCIFRGLMVRLGLGKQVVRVDREWNCPVGVLILAMCNLCVCTKVNINVAIAKQLTNQLAMNFFNRVGYLLTS